jgi:hypothetical protein
VIWKDLEAGNHDIFAGRITILVVTWKEKVKKLKLRTTGKPADIKTDTSPMQTARHYDTKKLI